MLCARQVAHYVEQDGQDLVQHKWHVLRRRPQVRAGVMSAWQEHLPQQHVAAALGHPVKRRASGSSCCTEAGSWRLGEESERLMWMVRGVLLSVLWVNDNGCAAAEWEAAAERGVESVALQVGGSQAYGSDS